MAIQRRRDEARASVSEDLRSRDGLVALLDAEKARNAQLEAEISAYRATLSVALQRIHLIEAAIDGTDWNDAPHPIRRIKTLLESERRRRLDLARDIARAPEQGAFA